MWIGWQGVVNLANINGGKARGSLSGLGPEASHRSDPHGILVCTSKTTQIIEIYFSSEIFCYYLGHALHAVTLD